MRIKNTVVFLLTQYAKNQKLNFFKQNKIKTTRKIYFQILFGINNLYF